MAKFALGFTKGTASVTQLWELLPNATRPRRIKLFDLQFGSISTPADTSFEFRVQKFTTTGTGAALTPLPLDPADAATEATAKDTTTVDGTFSGTNYFRQALNQRASFRWVAAPGSEIVSPATAANGLGFRLSAATVIDFAGTALVEEQ